MNPYMGDGELESKCVSEDRDIPEAERDLFDRVAKANAVYDTVAALLQTWLELNETTQELNNRIDELEAQREVVKVDYTQACKELNDLL